MKDCRQCPLRASAAGRNSWLPPNADNVPCGRDLKITHRLLFLKGQYARAFFSRARKGQCRQFKPAPAGRRQHTRLSMNDDVIDIAPLLAAINDPGRLGGIIAYSEMADELAQRDKRWANLADAFGELWPAMVQKNPAKANRAACKVLDECDRLAGNGAGQSEEAWERMRAEWCAVHETPEAAAAMSQID
jgi:hypothetical protein